MGLVRFSCGRMLEAEVSEYIVFLCLHLAECIVIHISHCLEAVMQCSEILPLKWQTILLLDCKL